MRIVDFENKHIDQAAQLLAAQFAGFLESFPLLPGRIVETGVAKNFLVDLLAKEDSHGVVMLDEGRVSGFLLGAYADNPFFGRHVYVPFGGIALKEQTKTDDLVKLYTSAGKRWLLDGALNHYLVLPALADWLETAFSLSFGKEQAYAAASVANLRLEAELPEGIEMREVVVSDADGLYECADWIAGHYNLAPVWEPVPAEYLTEIRKGYAELADEEESTTWIALDGKRIVSFVLIHQEDVSPYNLFGDPEVAHFSVAATDKEYRGRGIGRSLLTHVMNVACTQGYQTMTTDWRTTNPSAADHWPSFGFEPFAYRLLRRVNPRYETYSENN
jgi:ribosomal protein S18 acetylase RimI-like enzyme